MKTFSYLFLKHCLLALLLTSASVQAQSLYSEDFEGGMGDYGAFSGGTMVGAYTDVPGGGGNGAGNGMLIQTTLNDSSAGWWSGASTFNNADGYLNIDLSSYSLNTLQLFADVRTDTFNNAGSGAPAAFDYEFRLYDSVNNGYIAFDGSGQNIYQMVGGSLDAGALNGVFDFSSGQYAVTFAHSAGTLGQTPGAGEEWQMNLWVDNVSLSAVPEPAHYALMAGVLALGLVAWKRRRR